MNILFFDDTRLYNRQNLTRRYGVPTLCSRESFEDNAWLYQWPLGMWKEGDTHYMPVMLMERRSDEEIAQNVGCYYAAVMLKSRDGINWEPDNRARECGIENPLFEHQCMVCADNEEPAFIFYDENDIPARRYKAFSILIDSENHWVEDVVYCSSNCFEWKRMRGACWSCRGAEPGLSVFRIEDKNTNGLALRPTWGDRRICISTTDNFQSYTYPQLKLMPDSIDEPQLEFYGMRVHPYKGYYLGFLWQYHTRAINQNKFHGGKIDCHLAYSLNGLDWFRGLRTPFMPNGEEGSANGGMTFVSEFTKGADGKLYIYAADFKFEHGAGYRKESALAKYSLREDGFVCLEAGAQEGFIATRPIIINGDFDINIEAENASFAIYNRFGTRPIEGFDFENCDAFSGDNCHHRPTWRGHDISELYGQAVCLQIRLTNGRIYAVNGDITPITCHEAIRYADHNITLDTRGF